MIECDEENSFSDSFELSKQHNIFSNFNNNLLTHKYP